MQPQRIRPQLVVSLVGKDESILEIGDSLTIGRSPQSGLVLDDQSASRRHAEIHSDGQGGYSLLDAGSANGTWLNGRMLTAPRHLAHGDVIHIGEVTIRFHAPGLERSSTPAAAPQPGAGTNLSFRNETIVVLVSDIRNYTGISERLPAHDLSRFMADWFREGSALIERHGGIVDKFIGDSLMAYWTVPNPGAPADEVNAALRAARDYLALSAAFAQRLAAQFPGQAFRIGVGLNMGSAVLGNVGGGEHPSFTVVGDSVNVAFRLEALTKERGCSVVLSRNMAEHAASEFRFADLGQAEVKGRSEPVAISSLNL